MLESGVPGIGTCQVCRGGAAVAGISAAGWEWEGWQLGYLGW